MKNIIYIYIILHLLQEPIKAVFFIFIQKYQPLNSRDIFFIFLKPLYLDRLLLFPDALKRLLLLRILEIPSKMSK